MADLGFAPSALARDGCGRTWLLGEGVAVWDQGTLTGLPAAPVLAGRAPGVVTGRPTGVAWSDGAIAIDLALPCAGERP